MTESSLGSESSSKAPSTGLEDDLQRLVDAATSFADASVRPVVRVFNVVSDSIGEKDAKPRLRLSSVADTSQSLVDASVRLAEKLVTLAMDVVSPPPSPSARRQSIPTVVAGRKLRIPMSIENPADEPMTGIAFHVAELEGPEQTSLSAASLQLEPKSLTVAPRDFEKLVLVVDVPDDAKAGLYEGTLGLQGSPAYRVGFSFRVS